MKFLLHQPKATCYEKGIGSIYPQKNKGKPHGEANRSWKRDYPTVTFSFTKSPLS